MKKIFAYLSGIVLFLIVWIILSNCFSASIIPFPHDVGCRLLLLLLKPATYYHLLITLARTGIGFLLALGLGIVLGSISGRFLFIEKNLFIPVIIIQAAPPLLWIVPLMLILGTDGASPAAVVFFVTLPLVIITVQEGMKTIKKEMIDLFRIYASSKRMMIRHLYVPSLSSHLKSIAVLGSTLALKSSIMGEWFGAKDGIGRLINEYFYSFDMLSFYSTSFLYIIIIIVIVSFIKKIIDNLFQRRLSINHPIIQQYTGKTDDGEKTRKSKSIALLSIQAVSFSYGKKFVLNNIDFSMEGNKSIILTGDSGVGKTTFARIACGLLHPASGRIAIPSHTCLIFQDDLFSDHLDCFGNAALPAVWKKQKEYDSRVTAILRRCGLGDSLHLFPDELSGGMKKRLSFARALVFDPDFIILDEPFNKLHREARGKLWDLFFSLFTARDIPSIIITHYPEELASRGFPVIELKDGRFYRQE